MKTARNVDAKTLDDMLPSPQRYMKDAEWAEGDILALFDMTFPNQAWRNRAACKGADPAIFFDERGGVNHAANKFCNRCPVRKECEETGVDEYGWWGGMGRSTRLELKREKQRVV